MGAGTVQLNGGTLRTETAARVLANPISVTGASFLSSAHGLTLNGTLTNTGGNQSITTTLTGPAVLDINGNVFLSELSTVSRQLSFFGSGTRNFNGVIANNAGDNAVASHLFFNGSGLLNLNAENTYTGRTLAAGGGYIVISQDRNLGATPAAPVVDSLILAANGSLRAAATFELNINRGIGIGNSTGGTATGFIDVVANQVFTVAGSIADRTRNNDGTLTPANVGALSKTGTGVLVLSGANNYSGITTVSQGIVRLASNSALGGTSAGTLVTSAAHVELMNGVVITGETLTLNGGSGTVGTGSPDASRGGLQAAANASAEWAGNIVLGANNSRIGVQNGGTLLLSGNISDGGSNHTLVFSGDLIGAVSGPGAVVIAGTNNTWGGSTQIVRGTVKLGSHNTLPTATVLDIHFTAANNGEYAGLDMNGFNQTVGRLQNGGTTGANAVLTNSNATLSTMTVNEATSGTYAGVITGNVALAKTGAGVMTLTQANSYTGGTVIQEGTIRFGAGGALAQGNLTILGGATTGGTLDLNNITTATINGLSGGAGAVTGLIVNDSITNATRTLSVGVNHATSTYSGRIIDNNGGTAQGKVALAKIGTGALTLSGANTHTGSTAVSNGSIIADFGSNHPLGSSPIALQGGTLVVSNATAATIGTVSLLQSGADFTRGVLRIDNAATITTPSFIGSGFAPFLLDISNGGTFVASALSGMSVTNGVLVQGGSNRSTLYVQDSSGIGFATRNASNEIVRYTAGTAATATNSSSSTNFTLGSSLTRTAELQFHTLDINTNGGPVTLTMGSNNLSASGATGRGILISGTNDATITATSGAIGGGSVFISNYSTGTTTLDISLNGQATILAGPGLVDYTKTANPADLYVANGTFRMSGGSRDFNTGITRIFGDGVLEIGADLNAAADGDFTRVVGQGVNNVALIGNGGFSAHGADRVVALGGTAAPAALVWGANNFFSGPGGDNNYAFKLGSASSTHALEFRNAIDLGNRSRIFDVADGTASSNVDARLTGVLTGTGGSLIKAGSGRLEVTASNSYTGTTRVQSGTLQLAATGTTGTGAVTVDTGATLIGTGTVRGSSFDLSSGGALLAGNGTAVSDHGILTFNPTGVGQYDFQTGSTVSLSLQTATNQGTIDPTFGGHAIGSVEYNAYVDALGGVGSGLHDLLVFNGTSGSTLSFSSNLNVVPDGFTAQAGQVFNLMDWVNLMSTDFSGFNVGVNYRDGTGDNLSQFDLPELTGGLVWDVSRFTTSGAIVVVPEPSRMLLLAFALVGMLFSRRRL
jgi:autotransporter-associated beta strand protein